MQSKDPEPGDQYVLSWATFWPYLILRGADPQVRLPRSLKLRTHFRGSRSEARRRLESSGGRGDPLGDGQEPLVGPARAHQLEAERNPIAVDTGRDDHHRATADLR